MEINLSPSDILKPYRKYYCIFTNDKGSLTEALYPSGYIELSINISNANFTTIIDDRHIKMPNVEVLGQLSLTGKVLTTKGITLLVTRF